MSPLLALFGLLSIRAKVDDWKTFTMAGGYSIDSPVALKSAATPTVGQAKSEDVQVMEGVLKSDRYFTSLSHAPKETRGVPADSILAQVVAETLDDAKGKIQFERDLVFNGWPGVEVELTSSQGPRTRMRCFAVGDTVFVAAVGWPDNQLAPDQASRFLTSMCIPAKVGRGPLNAAGPKFEMFALANAGLSMALPKAPERGEQDVGTKKYPQKFIRFSATYLNRTYLCNYMDLPLSAAADLAGHEREALAAANDEVIRGVEGKAASSKDYLLDGLAVVTTTARLPSGFGLRVDSFFKGLRMYNVAAATPDAMLTSEEVQSFFKSLKVTPQDLHWMTVSLPGAYSISVPAPLKVMETSRLGPVPEGSKYWTAVHDDQAFIVDLGPVKQVAGHFARPDEILANAVRGLISESKGTILSQADLVRNGWPGIEVEFMSAEGHAKSRSYIVDGTLFQAMIVRPSAAPGDADAKRFLDSMSTADIAGRGPLKTAGPEFSEFALEGAGLSVRLPRKPEKSSHVFGPPTDPARLIRFMSVYGNRVYACGYADLPPDALDGGTQRIETIKEDVNADALREVGAKGRKDSTYTLGDLQVLSSQGSIEGSGAIRVDSFLKGHRLYSVMAAVPAALMGSDEVKAFFSSLKLDN